MVLQYTIISSTLSILYRLADFTVILYCSIFVNMVLRRPLGAQWTDMYSEALVRDTIRATIHFRSYVGVLVSGSSCVTVSDFKLAEWWCPVKGGGWVSFMKVSLLLWQLALVTIARWIALVKLLSTLVLSVVLYFIWCLQMLHVRHVINCTAVVASIK
jgi:hypothetical protein